MLKLPHSVLEKKEGYDKVCLLIKKKKKKKKKDPLRFLFQHVVFV
jgi:hypothetical protein